MKPRERKPQAQSSRMFLHNRDHRDAIYNDMYHNAMWANTENIDDKLVWVKYPKNALLMTYGSAFCWIDVDRQFQYGRQWGGGSGRGRPNVFGLECGIAVAYSQYGSGTSNFSVSDDGIVWQDINANFNPTPSDVWHFGEDGLCNITLGEVVMDEYYPFNHAGFTVRVALFSKNEETGKFEVELKTFSYTDIVRTAQFVCNTEQGCIINTTYGSYYNQSGTKGANDYTFWHIDHAGVKTQKYYRLWETDTIWDNLQFYSSNSYGFAYAKVGNRCFAIASTVNQPNRYDGNRYYRLWLLCTQDQGETWTGEKVFEVYVPATPAPTILINIKVCDGEVFAFYAINTVAEGFVTHMKCTLTGTQWDEVELPTWLDVPVIQGGGSYVQPNSSIETLRIAIDPTNTSDYNYRLGDILGDPRWDSNMRGMATMFSDGKLVKETDEVMRFAFGNVVNNAYCVFFDNRYLAENARAFAWQVADTGVTNIPDYVQNGDYCVPYSPTPFDPYQYPFWDYYIYVQATQEYVKVARITLPYYSEYYLVVVEYLPQVGANNVLYKVPRYNV